jgi:hypothetical protein
VNKEQLTVLGFKYNKSTRSWWGSGFFRDWWYTTREAKKETIENIIKLIQDDAREVGKMEMRKQIKDVLEIK